MGRTIVGAIITATMGHTPVAGGEVRVQEEVTIPVMEVQVLTTVRIMDMAEATIQVMEAEILIIVHTMVVQLIIQVMDQPNLIMVALTTQVTDQEVHITRVMAMEEVITAVVIIQAMVVVLVTTVSIKYF